MAEYVQQATPETLSAIMGFDSGLIDSTLFRDLMDARILIERECTRLACAKLTPASLQMLQAHTEAIYAADDAQAAEVVYLYHKCLTEISGNLAYAMVFQSFEKMIRNNLDLSAVPLVKMFSHLPIIIDPSHAAGRRDMVQPLSRAAIAAGADGLIIEAHNDPKHALCDGAQSLDLDQFDNVMADIKRRAEFEGRIMMP